MSGVSIIAEGTDLELIRVARVRVGSAGEEAGLKVGDLIRSADGRTASDLSPSALRTMFKQERSIQLRVERDGSEIPLTLKTRRRI